MLLFHRTTPEAAACIVEHGFRNHICLWINTLSPEGLARLLQRHDVLGDPRNWSGVWLSDRPVDDEAGAQGETLLQIDLRLSEADIADKEVDRPEPLGHYYREWLVDADLINANAKITILTEELVG